jgi:hypothetical protein
MNERRVDTFNSYAVYRKGCTNDFALEGTRYDSHKSYHAFLLIREDILVAAQLQTNETLSLEDIRTIYDLHFFNGQETTRNVPPHFERVAILPKNDISIGIQDHYPGAGWVVLMPVTIVVDVVTFPFQVIYVLCMGKYGT